MHTTCNTSRGCCPVGSHAHKECIASHQAWALIWSLPLAVLQYPVSVPRPVAWRLYRTSRMSGYCFWSVRKVCPSASISRGRSCNTPSESVAWRLLAAWVSRVVCRTCVFLPALVMRVICTPLYSLYLEKNPKSQSIFATIWNLTLRSIWLQYPPFAFIRTLFEL